MLKTQSTVNLSDVFSEEANLNFFPFFSCGWLLLCGSKLRRKFELLLLIKKNKSRGNF